jgi:thymidylate synthase
MKIEDIISMWQEDVKIDETELSRESLNIPLLHGKYLKHFSDERLKLRALKMKHKQLSTRLADYYRGDLNNPEDLAELGREPYEFKRLKQEVSHYVDSDSEMIQLNTKVAYQQELVDILEEIIKAINTRGYVIKNSLDFLRFTSGQ